MRTFWRDRYPDLVLCVFLLLGPGTLVLCGGLLRVCLLARCTLGVIGGVELEFCRAAVQRSLLNNRQDEELHLSCVLGAFI